MFLWIFVFALSQRLAFYITWPNKCFGPALTGVILGASKDNNLTHTSDVRQLKPHTVLNTTDRNQKLAPGYCNRTNTTSLKIKTNSSLSSPLTGKSSPHRNPTENVLWLFTHFSAKNTIKNGNVTRHGELNKYHISFMIWFLPRTLKMFPTDINIMLKKKKLNFWPHYIFNVTHFFNTHWILLFHLLTKKPIQHISKTQNNNSLHVKI